MKEIKIDHLVYSLKQAKKNNQAQPIFFLGAGASTTGAIPLAGQIVKKILEDYADNPFIKDLSEDKRTYAHLMDCLLPAERDELLKGYINDAKINVTHIYLAQLLNENYADYVLTVNFDNLMLRALALYNIFPATYDMAILKDLTTTTFKEKSVVYLHGQNHGLWLLNTPEEMAKVKSVVLRIFDSIKNGRPWVFIGYSGDDPIFDHIKNMGRFDNGLYWVTYNEHSPSEKVMKFLSNSNTNAFLIKGYDSDSFMLKLNSELGLLQPNIVDRPFTAIKNMLDDIVDIEDKDHFKGVKERLKISKRQIDDAIQQYEFGKVELTESSKEDLEIDLLKREIIDLIISDSYNEKDILNLENRAKEFNDSNLKELFSNLYNNWASYLGDLAEKEVEKDKLLELYIQSFEKYKRATEIKNDEAQTFFNWGTQLTNLARNTDINHKNVYEQAIEKFQKAIDLKPDYYKAYNNWGLVMSSLAKSIPDQAEILYSQAIEKYQKAIDLKPDQSMCYNNWGLDLCRLADIKKGKEGGLYFEAFDKFRKSIELNPASYGTYINWGDNLCKLALIEGQNANDLFNQAFEKFNKAIEIQPNNHEIYNHLGAKMGEAAVITNNYSLFDISFQEFKKAIDIKPDYSSAYENWGVYLGKAANLNHEGRKGELCEEALDKLQKAIVFGSGSYNLACVLAIKGDKERALFHLNVSLERKEINVGFVEKDDDWKDFFNDADFTFILDKYRDK